MTDTEAIALRANSATPGPWNVDGWHVFVGAGMLKRDVLQAFEDKDAEFTAHARTDIPELLARVRALETAAGLALAALRSRERAAGRMRSSAEVLFLTATLDGMRLAPEVQAEIDVLLRDGSPTARAVLG